MNFDFRLRKRSTYVRIYSACVLIGTLVAVWVCLFLKRKYQIIGILPATYCLCYFFCPGNRDYLNNISLTIINISSYCRYIIYPLIIAGTLNSGDGYAFDISNVWLLAYELVGVFVVVGLMAKKLDIPSSEFTNFLHSLSNCK